MFSTDPSNFQHLPRSEFLKRRAYWQLWKKANAPEDSEEAHPTIPGVSVSKTSNLVDGAIIRE